MRTLDRAFDRTFRLRQKIDPTAPLTIHKTRVAFKKFRYQIEVLSPLLPGVSEAQLTEMQEYQAMMGDIQDVTTLRQSLERFARRLGADPQTLAPLRQALDRRLERLIQRYLAVADRLNDFRPAQLATTEISTSSS